MDSRKRQPFLSLPFNIRLQIYKYALIDKQPIQPWLRRTKENSTTTLAAPLLRTCRQIYHEAAPVLYAGNEFTIFYPKMIIDWLQKTGPHNVKRLEYLRLVVPAKYGSCDGLEDKSQSKRLWLGLLEKLANKEMGLRFLKVYFDHDSWFYPGAGKDVRFVERLARFRGVQIIMDGYFQRGWPDYVENGTEKPVFYAYDGLISREKLRGLKRSYWAELSGIFKTLSIHNSMFTTDRWISSLCFKV